MKVELSDREAEALIAPWWRKLVWTSADWRCADRARRKVAGAIPERVARQIIAELREARGG